MEGHQITRTQDSHLILTFYSLLLLPCFRFHMEVYCIVQHTQCSYRQSHNSSTVSKYFNLFKNFQLDKNIQEVVIKLSNDNQSWVFTGRIDVEAETPILWPPDASWERLRAGGEGDNRG